MTPTKSALATFGVFAALAALLYVGFAIKISDTFLAVWIFGLAVLGAIAFVAVGFICVVIVNTYDWFRGF